jgi:hypothetical protein
MQEYQSGEGRPPVTKGANENATLRTKGIFWAVFSGDWHTNTAPPNVKKYVTSTMRSTTRTAIFIVIGFFADLGCFL